MSGAAGLILGAAWPPEFAQASSPASRVVAVVYAVVFGVVAIGSTLIRGLVLANRRRENG